ncbi:MAG: DUF4340 domain-containing protein [Verrucomicrobiota bacterium]
MNRKQLLILITLVAVIGGAGLLFLKRQHNSFSPNDQKIGKKLFPNLPINDVAQIQIKQSTNELNLVKKDDLWRVQERGDYPANFSQISDFLLKAVDLKIGQSEEIGASQFAKLELIDPAKGKNSGTLLQFKDKSGKNLQSAILGKKQMRKSNNPQMGEEGFPAGRYVLLPDDSKNVYLLSDPLSDVEAKPENWLNKDFFKIEKVKAISLVATNATNSWKLSRTNETGAWVLADVKAGEIMDTNKVSGVANSLSSPAFVDVVVNGKPEQTGLDKPIVVTLETFDGLVYTLNIGKTSGEGNYYLTVKIAGDLLKERIVAKDEKPEEKSMLDKNFSENHKKLDEKLTRENAFGKWTYLVAKWTIDPLLRDRAQLMVEKKEEPKKDDSKKADTLLDPVGDDK